MEELFVQESPLASEKAEVIKQKTEAQKKNGGKEKIRAQMAIYNYFREKYWNPQYSKLAWKK